MSKGDPKLNVHTFVFDFNKKIDMEYTSKLKQFMTTVVTKYGD